MVIPLSIFLVALITRCLLGYAFFGSIDVSAFIGITTHTFNETLVTYPFTIWCSFPVIPFYTWLCGLLSIITPLPLAFCFKTIPILFDSLLALLVYDFVAVMRPAQALRAGMLYALCPLALLVTCIHGQWDAMPLLFLLLGFFVRDSYPQTIQQYFVYGVLFAFSFMLKPLPLVFLFFFFVPWPGLKKMLASWWRPLQIISGILGALLIGFFVFFKCNKTYSLASFFSVQATLPLVVMVCGAVAFLLLKKKPWQSIPPTLVSHIYKHLAACAGLTFMVSVCLALLTCYGFHPLIMIDKILRYFNQGIAVFGLPFADPCKHGIIALILKNRFWIMGLIGSIAIMYYQQRIDLYRSLLLALMAIFTFSGLSPQYLIWACPLFMITGLYRAGALFNAIGTALLVFYYMNPLSNPEVPYQNMLSFAPLKHLSWLTPPEALTNPKLLPIITLLGNYALPLCCAAIAITILVDALWDKPHTGKLKLHSRTTIAYGAITLTLTAGIGLLMLMYTNASLADRFKSVTASGLKAYNIIFDHAPLSGNYGPFSLFNIITIIAIITGIWTTIAVQTSNDYEQQRPL